MDRRKIIATVLIGVGIAIMAVPFYWHFSGKHRTEQLLTHFEKTIEYKQEDDDEEEEQMEDEGKTALSEEDAAVLEEGNVIGIIEIESIGIRYPVIEGTGNAALNSGIGHITETAGIGDNGNCVLCGHNGSRYGTFFTPLCQVKKGDEVSVMDDSGEVHLYKVEETFVTNPYDNSIKTQGEEKELTLFTCANKGTMRLVARCKAKEE